MNAINGLRRGVGVLRAGCGAVVLLVAWLTAGCSPRAVQVPHVLEGAWLASDDTIFIFRPDGTFHGIDCNEREIWGNWVRLSDERIGFQSLLHDQFYDPQYAIINATNRARMDYIVTGGTGFIDAQRIPVSDASRRVETVIRAQIHRPPPRP
jgi:hypothetical protein